MISFSELPLIKHQKQETPLHSALMRCVQINHAAGAALLRIHPNYKDVYVICSTINGLASDGIYQEIKNHLPQNESKSFSLNRFGNVEGSFYCTLSPINSDDTSVVVALLSSNPISLQSREGQSQESDTKVSSPNDIQDVNFPMNNHTFDIDTLMDHVRDIPYLDKVKSNEFSIEILNDDHLFELVIAMFFSTINETDLPIDRKEFILYIDRIRSLYNDVPYHNWRHAVDATQFVYFILSKPEISDHFLPIHKFALLLSSICHDVEHDGKTNDFHRKVNSPFAVESGDDMPPLEYHHQACCLSLLSKTFPKVIEKFTEDQKKTFNTFVSEIILATDMGRHKYFVDKINEIAQTWFDGSEEQRLIGCQAIMKLADLSNTCRLFGEASFMSSKLRDEWFIQGDAESKLGLPITNGYDRHNQSPLCKGQVGFYKFVTQSLLQADQNLFKVLDDCVNQFNSNLSEWESQVANL